ncbi:probable tyrosyl-DNA phosphodiesterase isoform X2 [Harpegnathos saltator]|uniref:probable tyrosyl-DNA phosphodiesterase isoform X2 n=1 Tax=Harpegnathos saltator TaxID=610380 RepID=UPI000DBED3CE|nr:probable tyrosyl-DNA phosphodiesterase isoform X2 [Harpegnathos saltator]
MDTTKACYLQSSTIREKSKNTNKEKSFVELYRAHDSEKSRKEAQEEIIRIMRDYGYNVVKPEKFAQKYNLSAPYHLFFTTVEESKETHNQPFSVTFPEILDKSLGEIVNSLHLTFIVDVEWLCLQYALAGQRTDMTILYHNRRDDTDLSDNISIMPVYEAELVFNSETHHTKIMILQYKDDGIRVVVSTANLYSNDWENRTQGLWISPHLPRLPELASSSDGESPTNFKQDFKRYLSRYWNPALKQWMDVVNYWGHRKLARVLFQHTTLPPDAPQWSIIAQSSSIGNLGPNYESWLSKEIVLSMSQETMQMTNRYPKFQYIYPSVENYERSFDFRNSISCFYYTAERHSKQQWIEPFLHQWKATRTGRDRAMPHIKSYMRISPDLKRISWFMLTSANLSKSAWGVKRSTYSITNYEAGVVFLPKFITGATTFPITYEEDSVEPIFPIPYDLPLCPYDSSDSPLFIRPRFRE